MQNDNANIPDIDMSHTNLQEYRPNSKLGPTVQFSCFTQFSDNHSTLLKITRYTCK